MTSSGTKKRLRRLELRQEGGGRRIVVVAIHGKNRMRKLMSWSSAAKSAPVTSLCVWRISASLPSGNLVCGIFVIRSKTTQTN